MAPTDPFDVAAARDAITSRLEPGEDIDDVMDLAVHLARRRAELLGRGPEQSDLEFALASLCWWPGKTEPPSEVRRALVRVRGQLLRYRGSSLPDRTRRLGNYLAEAVTERSLSMSFSELEEAQQRGIRHLDTSVLDSTQGENA